MTYNLFGHRKKRNTGNEINEKSIRDSEILLNHNKITIDMLLAFVIIALIAVYILFQEKSCILYCDKSENYCEIRRESNIGFRTARDLFSPSDITNVDAKLNFTERFIYGPIKLQHAGNRVYHSIYIINKQKNQIPIYTRYDHTYTNSKLQKKLKKIAKEVQAELEDENKKIIQYNLSKAYKRIH